MLQTKGKTREKGQEERRTPTTSPANSVRGTWTRGSTVIGEARSPRRRHRYGLRRGAPEHLGEHGGLLGRRHGRLPHSPQDLQLHLALLPGAQPHAHLHLHREPRHRAHERPLFRIHVRVAVALATPPHRGEAGQEEGPAGFGVVGLRRLWAAVVVLVRVRVREQAAEVGALQAEEALHEALGEERVHNFLAAVVPDAEREAERRDAGARVGRAQQRDEPRELAARVELVHQRAPEGVHQAVERTQRRRRGTGPGRGRGLNQRADGGAHEDGPDEHVLVEAHQRQHRGRAAVAHGGVREPGLHRREHAVAKQLALEPRVEPPAQEHQPCLELREERARRVRPSVAQRGHEARDGLAVDPRLDLAGDGASHARDRPLRGAPAAPRAKGQGAGASCPLAAQVEGARQRSEPVEQAAQGDDIGVAGEEVVGAGLEREERLQRRPSYLPGLHPPRGVPQRSQHVEEALPLLHGDGGEGGRQGTRGLVFISLVVSTSRLQSTSLLHSILPTRAPASDTVVTKPTCLVPKSEKFSVL